MITKQHLTRILDVNLYCHDFAHSDKYLVDLTWTDSHTVNPKVKLQICLNSFQVRQKHFCYQIKIPSCFMVTSA
jgi:hypothetical protein